jgi:hypothetical protein
MAAVKMGSRDLALGTDELGELTDSTPLLHDGPALRARLADDGYLLLRGVIDRDRVLRARNVVRAHAREQGWVTDEARMAEGVAGQFLGGLPISRDPAVLDVLEAPALFETFATLLDEPVLTFPYKWMRLVGRKEFTGAHIDHVYMSRGSSRLTTAWVPLGDVPLEQGPLAICVGSHRLPAFEKLHATYGDVDVDRDLIDGIFTLDPLEVTETFGGRWCTSTFEAGDVLVFTMRTMHASLNNTSDRCRISCDVRWQPASEPADERWVGENPLGHYGLHSGKRFISVAEARRRWDL